MLETAVQFSGHDGGELKTRAETGLIPAGKHAARIGGFELRAEHHLLRAGAVLLIRRVIKPLALLVDLAREKSARACACPAASSAGRVMVKVSCCWVELDRRLRDAACRRRRRWRSAISTAFSTSSRTGLRTLSLIVSEPVKVSFLTSGAMRIAYSSGTTCFGSLPGVVSKSKGCFCAHSGEETRAKAPQLQNRKREAHPPTKQRAAASHCDRARVDAIQPRAEHQLAVADLRAFDHQRAALTQLRFGFEEELLLLEQLQIEQVRSLRFAAFESTWSEKYLLVASHSSPPVLSVFRDWPMT